MLDNQLLQEDHPAANALRRRGHSMINRRVLLNALAGATLAASFEASVQAADKVWKIGSIGPLQPGATAPVQYVQTFAQSDVLVVCTTPNTRAAKAATKTVPIVMWAVSDPVERGLVVSLARPEGNITGVADFSTSLLPKQLELLKVSRIGIYRPAGDRRNPATRSGASGAMLSA
jgi:ABC transporter substrate binding protein